MPAKRPTTGFVNYSRSWSRVAPDSSRGLDIELLREVGDAHVLLRLYHLPVVRLQLARDDLQLRRLAGAVNSCSGPWEPLSTWHCRFAMVIQTEASEVSLVANNTFTWATTGHAHGKDSRKSLYQRTSRYQQWR